MFPKLFTGAVQNTPPFCGKLVGRVVQFSGYLLQKLGFIKNHDK